MATEFKIPELGENVTAGDVVRIMVNPGDALEKDQPVLELETDKATIEVPSDVSGTVKEIKVKQGDKVNVGQVILTLDEGEGGGKAPKPEKPEKPEKAEKAEKPEKAEKAEKAEKPEKPEKPEEKEEKPAKAAKAAAAGESKPQPAGAPEEGGMSQAEPGKARESGADASSGGRKGAEERDQGTVEEEAPAQTEEDKPARKRGQVVDIQRGARPSTPPAPEVEPEGPPPPAAPSVRRIARELGVDITRVTGTGADGRISAEDVQEYVKGVMSGRAGGGPAPAQLPDFSKWGEVERKPMSNIRRKTAAHLSGAWTTIPHVTQHDKADITDLEALRKHYGAQAEKAGGKMTMTAIAMKIVAAAMKRFPQFNASADMARQEIVYKKAVHLGVAVDTERGLLVPVIRDVDAKGVIELSVELSKISERARAGKLSLDDMQGGGMTITNLGGIGGTSFTPIVNWPEVAILGISRGAIEPVWHEGTDDEDGDFEPRLMLPLSLSYDHRVIDGADAARFLRWVCEAFEQPFVLAL